MADITYLPKADKFVYLGLVADAYWSKIVSWYVHGCLQSEPVAQALRMALRGRQSDQPLVHHSDRGVQDRSISRCTCRLMPMSQRHIAGRMRHDRHRRMNNI